MHPARLVLALLLGTASGLAAAHYPWLTLDSHAPGAGEALQFEVAWGHRFPVDGVLSADRLESLTLVGTQGVHAIALNGKAERFTVPAAALEGAAVLVGVQRTSYYSRTPEGGRRGSRKDFPDARSCSLSNNTVKALVGGGAEAGAAGIPVGHAFELVVEAGPGALSAGGTLPLRIVFHDQPWQGEVNAIYAGYQKAEGEADYPVQLMTDAQGRVAVPLDRAGHWMVRASTGEDYPNPDVCDRLHYNATLTITVR